MKATILGKNGPMPVDLNRRRAARERCLQCTAWSSGAVSRCSHADCSLHPFRTGRGKQDPASRATAIREYCLWCMADNRNEVRLCPTETCALWGYRLARASHGLNSEIQGEKESPACSFRNQNPEDGLGPGPTLQADKVRAGEPNRTGSGNPNQSPAVQASTAIG